ncbi:MAG: adenylate/guanylate cyclase domain-containing protein [Nitrososphaeraceae archaeon]
MIYHASKDFKFIQSSKKCCVGFIDLVNSTNDTLSIINQVKIESYYSLFINTLTKIINRYDGEVVKNIGDCLLFYFPKTSKSQGTNEFEKVIECFLEILESRSAINEHLSKENLPLFSYRITVDFGALDLALTGSYNQIDIFGSVINICSKLNSISIPNEITIGENLYKLLSSFTQFFNKYDSSLSGEYLIAEDNKYLLYTITRTKNNYTNNSTKPSSHIFIEQNNTHYQTEEREEIAKLNINPIEYENNNSNSKKIKIIIIDDDKDIILTFKSMLENNNKCKINDKTNNNSYDITTFTEPELAIKYLKGNIYSFNNNNRNDCDTNNILVILDIRMKKINGIQLYKQIKSLDSSIKILFVTALDILDELKSMIPGLTAEQIKKKPVEEKSFLKTINKMLLSN